MSAPLRYRLALLALPRQVRRVREQALLDTLLLLDEDRGGPSTREAFSLVISGVHARAAAIGRGPRLGILIAAGALAGAIAALTGPAFYDVSMVCSLGALALAVSLVTTQRAFVAAASALMVVWLMNNVLTFQSTALGLPEHVRHTIQLRYTAMMFVAIITLGLLLRAPRRTRTVAPLVLLLAGLAFDARTEYWGWHPYGFPANTRVHLLASATTAAIVGLGALAITTRAISARVIRMTG
jgi:hypothetical protein